MLAGRNELSAVVNGLPAPHLFAIEDLLPRRIAGELATMGRKDCVGRDDRAEYLLRLAVTWLQRHNEALARLNAAAGATEAELREAQAAYDAIMAEGEAGAGCVTIN
jgi:hypothetical protein